MIVTQKYDTLILKAIINFPITTDRFDVSLLFLIEYGFLYC